MGNPREILWTFKFEFLELSLDLDEKGDADLITKINLSYRCETGDGFMGFWKISTKSGTTWVDMSRVHHFSRQVTIA